MEAVKGQLEICSSAKELSRFGGASTSEHTMNNHRIKLERASYHCNLETESRNKGAKAAAKKSLILGCSSSRANLSCNKGKAVLSSSSQVEELNERLRILEEETESMKQELLESAEERKKLMNEIYHQVQMLARDFRLSHGNTSVNSQEDERRGTSLSDIIVHRDLHKDLRADILALPM